MIVNMEKGGREIGWRDSNPYKQCDYLGVQESFSYAIGHSCIATIVCLLFSKIIFEKLFTLFSTK